MPFGLLWCCYTRSSQHALRVARYVTNAFRPFVVLLQGVYGDVFQQVLGHQCLSAFCGVVTISPSSNPSQSLSVTNAFRPFVVLLLDGEFHGRDWHVVVTNAFRPFVVLLPQRYRQGPGRDDRVTNAFRPFVVLLLGSLAQLLAKANESPMPFGLLWCCYHTPGPWLATPTTVTNAFRPFVVLLRKTESNTITPRPSHQCLSAFCGVVTRITEDGSAVRIIMSPMPFGLLWCCYRSSTDCPAGASDWSPMPFGLLWCCYVQKQCGAVLASKSPMPFGLLWCCYMQPSGTLATSDESPMPFGLLWCCYRSCLRQDFIRLDGVTNAFRPFVVLLLLHILITHSKPMSHHCLSAFCGVVTKPLRENIRPCCCSHQCLSAFCGVVTYWKEHVATAPWCHQCLSAFCGVVTFLQRSR